MKTTMIAAVFGITSMLTTGAAMAGEHDAKAYHGDTVTQHSSMTGDSAYQGGKTGASQLPGGHDKNTLNAVDDATMEGKAAYGMTEGDVSNRADRLQGGHIKNKPNDVSAPALEGAAPSDGVNNEGYNEIPGPLNKTPR